MSRIFTFWKCEHCGEEFQKYISFGHPDKDFVFKWKCGKCEHVNELLVKAMPMFVDWDLDFDDDSETDE